jgi:hypothetical protein
MGGNTDVCWMEMQSSSVGEGFLSTWRIRGRCAGGVVREKVRRGRGR